MCPCWKAHSPTNKKSESTDAFCICYIKSRLAIKEKPWKCESQRKAFQYLALSSKANVKNASPPASGPKPRCPGRLSSCHLVLISFKAVEGEEGLVDRRGFCLLSFSPFFFVFGLFLISTKGGTVSQPIAPEERITFISKHKDYFIISEYVGAGVRFCPIHWSLN